MASTLKPGTIVGEYRIEKKIGEGGMATVYGATHPLIGKQAAIKVMSQALSADAAAVARFALEARAVNRIGHPNIVDVFGFGRLPDGRSYFVMERLHGETLYDRLWKQQGPLPLPEVLDILAQICDALEAAHEKGIIHRDLKPANVFLCAASGRPQRVKLLDFGVAKLQHHESSPRCTSAGCVVGTPEYISPEQARGKNVDGRTDLYALGVIAYEMVLGRRPFLSDNPADAIQMNLCAPPLRPSILWKQIPPALESLMLRLLAKRPDERATLSEVRATLRALRPTATPALQRVDDAPPPSLPRGRHAMRLAALAVGFVMLVLAIYRPAKLRAQRERGAAPSTAPLSVDGRTPRPAQPSVAMTAARALPAHSPRIGAALPASATRRRDPSPRPVQNLGQDENYLLDPFTP